MSQTIELRLEVEPIKPDTPAIISSLMKDAIYESISSSKIEQTILSQKPSVVFQQNLPTKEELSLIIAFTQLVITAGQIFYPKIKVFLEHLFTSNKLKKSAPTKINFELSIGDKKIAAKNLNVEDTFKWVFVKVCG